MGGREPGRLANLASAGLIERSRSTQGAALGGRPLAPPVRRTRRLPEWVDRVGGCFSMERLTELKTIVIELS
jgi:hypothetical protein